MKLEKWYTVLVWIVTMFFCCFEISIFIRGYMQYKTTTKIKIEYEEVVRIPAVVTCFDTFPPANVSKLFHEVQSYESVNMTVVTICDQCMGSDSTGNEEKFRNFSQLTLVRIKPFSKGNQVCLHASLTLQEVKRSIFFTTLDMTMLMLSFESDPSSHDARFIEFYLTPYGTHFFDPSNKLLMARQIGRQ